MSPRSIVIGQDRRVSVTVGAIILGVGAIIGGAGATFSFKATAESKDAEHDRTLADHEGRIKNVEKDATDRLARLETKVDEIIRRLTP